MIGKYCAFGLLLLCTLVTTGCSQRTGGAENLAIQKHEVFKDGGQRSSLSASDNAYFLLWAAKGKGGNPSTIKISKSADGTAWELQGEVFQLEKFPELTNGHLNVYKGALLAVLPQDPDGEKSLLGFISEDEGKSWKRIESFPRFKSLPLISGGDHTLYALNLSWNGGDVGQSSDGGNTWIKKETTDSFSLPTGYTLKNASRENGVELVVDSNDTLHLARVDVKAVHSSGRTGRPVVHFVSRDSGATWEGKLLGEGAVGDISFAKNTSQPKQLGIAYATTPEEEKAEKLGLLLSNDGGKTWEETLYITTEDSAAKRTNITLGMDGQLMVMTYHQGGKLFLTSSKDGGKSWSKEHEVDEGAESAGLAIVGGKILITNAKKDSVGVLSGTVVSDES